MDVPEKPAEHDPAHDASRIRASDADRDRVADQLREALAEGRITPEEHEERLEAVFTGKTYADLARLVEDLPVDERPLPGVDLRKPTALPEPASQGTSIVAAFSGAERRGRWLVEPATSVLALCGGVDLDFRRAVLSQQEVTINITCVFGGVEIKVPSGVRVVNAGSAVFGGWSVPEDTPVERDAPVIRLTGLCVFGGVDVKVVERPPETTRSDTSGTDLPGPGHVRHPHRRHGH